MKQLNNSVIQDIIKSKINSTGDQNEVSMFSMALQR